MPEVTPLTSMKPTLTSVTPQPSVNATSLNLGALTPTPPLPWEELHMQVHTILITVIFCVVCLLLLLAFTYAFCIHCSIGPSPKDSHRANGCSPDREDATYKRSSSDGPSVGNVVWLGIWTRITHWLHVRTVAFLGLAFIALVDMTWYLYEPVIT